MRVFGTPVVPPVSNTKTGLPASPFGIQRCTGPPRSHSSSNCAEALRDRRSVVISRRGSQPAFVAKSSQNGEPVAGSKCQSTTSRTQASSGRPVAVRLAKRAWHRSIAVLAGRPRCDSSQRSCTCCTRTSGSGARRGRSSSASCRSASSITPPTRSRPRCCCGCWCERTGPSHLEDVAARMIPAVVVFAYLGVGARHRHLRVARVGATAGRRGLLPRRPIARPGRVPAVAVRHEHDGVLDPRRLGPRLRQRHRHLRPDGVLVGADHPARPLRDRHAAVGARQAPRLHDAGADVPRPLGVRPHRHGDLRRAGGAARALHRHRGDGRRHDAASRQRRAGAVLARRRDRVARGDGLRVLRRHARHRVGQHVSDRPLPVVRRDRGRR